MLYDLAGWDLPYKADPAQPLTAVGEELDDLYVDDPSADRQIMIYLSGACKTVLQMSAHRIKLSPFKISVAGKRMQQKKNTTYAQ